MRALGIVLVVATLIFGCNVCIATDEPSKPGSQVLFDSMNTAYQSLKSCIGEKLRATSKSRRAIYSEIADSGAFTQVLLDEKEFLGTPKSDVLAGTNSERVRLVIEALQRAEPYATEKSFMYKAFGLRRQIAAASIIARAPSIHCERPRELGYWVQEEDDYEVLTNLWTFSKPFMECEDKHVASIGGRGPALVDVLVRERKLPELKRLSIDFLGSSNPYVVLANEKNETDSKRMQALIEGVVTYSVGGINNERYGVKVKRLMVLVLLERIESTATQSKCVVSPALAHWIEEIDKRTSQQ